MSVTTGRWPDERIDDLALEVRSLRRLPEHAAEMTVELRGVKEDMDALFEQFRMLGVSFDQYRDEQAAEAEKRRIERKADLRWIVGTIIAAGGLIIAAVGLLVR